jgi:hypothetical protein
MNRKWRTGTNAIIAVLIFIIAYQFMAALWRSIHLSFANDQTQIFCEMTTGAEQALAQEPPNIKSALGFLEYIVNYYPSGTKQTLGSTLDIIVERSRSLAEARILEKLRAKTGKDFGTNAQDWLRGLATATQVDGGN